ncbi:hypothetical protein H5410_040727 [Solanum commersonii]|uniref:Uncharacterized protein n=1 Tax=Solanum commersonii TaxID=4109 RepID=A0A9J5XQZ2_SOLCO|nr:hypothetical protein H5410_040727 [Solanum commersonii]
MKKDPKTKSLYGQELLDLIEKRIQEYCITPQKGIITKSSVRHIAQKISIQDENKEDMIKNYLEEIKRNLLLNITQYEKSDTSMRSETSDDVIEDIQEAQPDELAKPLVIIRDTSFDGLKGEIKNLKNEIKSLKQNQMICDHHLTQVETATTKGKVIAEENTLAKPIKFDPRQDIITAKGFFVTYKNRDISYIFITDPISRDINALIK